MSFRIPKNSIQAFQFVPFSTKQKKVLCWWMANSPYKDYDAIIADGSVRSGKTLSMSLSFCLWAMGTFTNRNFGICGKTIGSLRRNVINDLKRMLRGRGYTVEDYKTENLLLVYRNGVTNSFYMFGGKDESSQDLIQGITLAGVFFDEVALMPESFVTQATARCSIEGAKFWFNCNPDGPYHWFKLEWLDNCVAKRVFYLHFTMDDNLSLGEGVKDRYKRMFSGIFYKRFILGLWVLADGVIYDMFNEDKNVRRDPFKRDEAQRLFIAVDYGIQNPMTYGKYGVRQGHYHLFDYYYHSGRAGRQKTDVEYADDLIKFIGNDKIAYVTIDPSATSFIAELRSRKVFTERNIKIVPARNDVIKGIQLMGGKLQTGQFTIDPECNEDLKEFSSYIWDAKAVARGEDKPLKENDHCMDRNRYALLTDVVLFSSRVNYSGRGAQTA